MCLAAGVARPLTQLPQQGPAGGEQQQATEAPPVEAPQQPGTSARRSASPHPSAGGVWLALLVLVRHTYAP